jgi:hypothetical protein
MSRKIRASRVKQQSCFAVAFGAILILSVAHTGSRSPRHPRAQADLLAPSEPAGNPHLAFPGFAGGLGRTTSRAIRSRRTGSRILDVRTPATSPWMGAGLPSERSPTACRYWTRRNVVTGIDPSGRGGTRQVSSSPVSVKELTRVDPTIFGNEALSTLSVMVPFSWFAS